MTNKFDLLSCNIVIVREGTQSSITYKVNQRVDYSIFIKAEHCLFSDMNSSLYFQVRDIKQKVVDTTVDL